MDKLKVTELQKLCREAGLKTSGNKKTLIERLEFRSAQNSINNELVQRVADLEATIAKLTTRAASVEDDESGEPDVEVLQQETSGFAPLAISSPLIANVETAPVQAPVVSAVQVPMMMHAKTHASAMHNIGTGYAQVNVSTMQNVHQSAPQYTVTGSVPQFVNAGTIPHYMGNTIAQPIFVPAPVSCGVQQNYVPLTYSRPQTTSNMGVPFTSVKDIVAVLPEFNPTNENSLTSMQFVQRIQMLKNAYQWRDDLVIFAVQQKLQGHAKMWADAQCEIPISWTQFASKLTLAFPFDENSASAHIKLANTKREIRETPSNYYFRMLALGTKYGVPDVAIARYIINGINDSDLRKKISNDYSSCVDLLKDIEAYCRFNDVKIFHAKPEINETVQVKNKIISYNQGTPTNETVQLKNKTFPYNQSNSNKHIKCYNCNKYGHIAAKCREARKDERHTEVTTKRVNKVETAIADKNAIIKTIKINGRVLEALVDPGSARTLMRTSLAGEMENISSCNVILNGFGGGQYLCEQQITAEVQIDDQQLKIDCLLVNDELLEHEVLVGRDVLCHQGTRVIIQEEDCWMERAEKVTATAADLQPDEGRKLKQIISANRQCFAESIHELGTCSIRKMDIKLLSTVPINAKPYRIEFAKRQKVKELTDELLRANIIRVSESPYASPVVVVPKKNNELRLCVDYRQLNKITEKMPFPMPIIDEQLAKLAGNKYFTTMDLRMGYHQVDIEEDAKRYTAFVTMDAHYEYNRMPFGLVNAPAVFQSIMNSIVNKMGADEMLAYLDDVVIPSKTVDEGLRRLGKFLEILCEVGLTLRLEKCNFLALEISYLGHKISADGITPGENKVSAVKNFAIPGSVSEVRRFLGLTGFFRKFIKDYAVISKPLTFLLHKAECANFRWDEPQQKAFDTLIHNLCTKPLLTLYDFNLNHEVHTDASSLGLAGVLLQSVDNKQWKPVCYFSRQCSDTESRYHAYELEVLAAVETLTRFRIYLLGKPFRLVTDCSAIAKAREKKELIPKISRWYMRLMEFNFEAIHRPGNRLAHVDALSRAPNEPPSETRSAGFVMSVEVGDDNWLLSMQLQDENLSKIISVLKGDSTSDQIAQLQTDYKLVNLRLYRRKEGLKFVVPKSVRWRIVKLCHDDVGHFGLEKTLERINKNFWFKRMRKYVKEYILACAECCYNKARGGMPEGRMQATEIEPVPFVTLHVDHLGPFIKSSRGMCYVIAMSDAFTKYLVVKPVRNTSTGPVIAALKDISSYFGLPKRLITDRAASFTSKAFEDYCNRNNIQHIKTAVRTPRANGQVERANQLILNFLRTTTDKPKDWDVKLHDLQWAVNSQKNNTSGFTPNELLFDFSLRDVVQNSILAAVHDDQPHQEDVPIAEKRQMAAERILNERQRWKKRFDEKHKQPTEYNVDDLVVVAYEQPATGESRKLEPKYRGPYIISRILGKDRYVVSDVPGMQMTQRPFDSVYTSEKLKPWCSSCPELDPDDDDDTSTGDDA